MKMSADIPQAPKCIKRTQNHYVSSLGVHWVNGVFHGQPVIYRVKSVRSTQGEQGMLKRKTLSAGAGMDIRVPFRGGLLAIHINVNFLRRTKTFSPRAKRLQMTFRAQRQFRYVAGDVRVNIFARGWTYGRGQPLSLTLSLGEIPWFDEKGEIRRCDWPRKRIFLYVPSMNYQAMGSSSANHSAVFHPSHQTTEFRQTTV